MHATAQLIGSRLWLAPLLAAAVACGGSTRKLAAPEAASGAAPAREAPTPTTANDAASPRLAMGPGGGQVASTAGPAAQQPLLIYTANVVLGVFEADGAIDRVEALARGLGGYLVRRDQLVITIRVPAAAFDGALHKITGFGDVVRRQVEARDVTAEFRDLEIRLRNLEAVRTRMIALLDQAKSIKDALAVEQQLERLSGQIEQIKGQLKLLGELVAFSTITVTFQARPTETVNSNVRLPFPWLDELGLSRLLQL